MTVIIGILIRIIINIFSTIIISTLYHFSTYRQCYNHNMNSIIFMIMRNLKSVIMNAAIYLSVHFRDSK